MMSVILVLLLVLLGPITVSALMLKVCISSINKNFAILFIILYNVHQSHSLTNDIPSFIYRRSTEPPKEGTFKFEITLSWEQANMIILVLNTILLIVIIFRFSKVRKAPLLILEVTNTKQCVFIPLMKLPLCPSHSAIKVPTNISDLRVSGPWYSKKLKITWSNCTVSNEITEKVYSVPNAVHINPLVATKLGNILKQPFFVHIHTEHYGYLSPVSALMCGMQVPTAL